MKQILDNRKADNRVVSRKIHDATKYADLGCTLLERQIRFRQEKEVKRQIYDVFKQDYIAAKTGRKKVSQLVKIYRNTRLR